MTEQLSVAKIIRTLGRGKKGTRDLTESEARFVMQSIIDEQITLPQLGAFLMLMRVKEETAEELTGMIRAVEESLQFQPTISVDVNWPAYAGKKKQPSWYVLSALLLANNGVKILMHGGGEHTEGRQYASAVCAALDIPVVSSLKEAEAAIERCNIAYIAAEHFVPKLSQLIDMKAELGLRSPVNTLIRHVNPLAARLTLQGMFHPAYMPLHHQTAQALNQTNNMVLKGDGGEFEVRPDSNTAIAIHADKQIVSSTEIAPVLKQRAVRPQTVELQPLLDCWMGHRGNEYGEATIIQTAAVILGQLKTISLNDAQSKVEQFWQQRSQIQ